MFYSWPLAVTVQTFVEIGSAVRKIFPDKKKLTDRKLKSSRTANAGRSTNNSLISLSILFNFFNFFPTLVFRGLKKIIIIIIIIYQLYVSRILSLLCCIIEYHSNVCHLTVTVNQSISQSINLTVVYWRLKLMIWSTLERCLLWNSMSFVCIKFAAKFSMSQIGAAIELSTTWSICSQSPTFRRLA